MCIIYGIDLGTTYSKCALVRPPQNILSVLMLDSENDLSDHNTMPILRSAVTLGTMGSAPIACVGAQSLDFWLENDSQDEPMRRFEETKIAIGEAVRRDAFDPPPWDFPPHDWQYRPEDISALVLRKIKQEVEKAGAPPLERIVLTHPQYFTDSRREATRRAAEIAGIEVVDTLTEPDAAAMAYGVESEPGRYMVFDMGGGTLDVTVCKLSHDGLEVLSSEGLKEGGRDFDRLIYRRMVEEYQTLYPSFEPEYLQPEQKQDWMRKAEATKLRLNKQNIAKIKYACCNDLFEGLDKTLVLHDTDLDTMTQPLIEGSVMCASAALDGASMAWSDLDGVLLVGGTTRLKLLRQAIAGASGERVRDSGVDESTAIARGAAHYAFKLATGKIEVRNRKGEASGSGQKPRAEYRVQGVLARGLGVLAWDKEERRNTIVNLIPKGKRLPIRQAGTFSTHKDAATELPVTLYEGEQRDPDLCDRTGVVRLSGFEPGPRGQPVKVTIEVEANGTKHLIVEAMGKREEAVIEFDPDRVVAADDIERRRAFIGSILIQ